MSPWKPCDIRGVVPKAVSEEFFDRVGAALAWELTPGEQVIVGGDYRTSTPALQRALIASLSAGGLHVIDCGQAPTPLFYFHLAQTPAAAVFIVTASHNPAEYNGLKWMIRGLPPSPSDIDRIRAAAEAGSCRPAPGCVTTADPVPAYRIWMRDRWRALDARRFGPIVIDAGNGAWSRIAPAILGELGFDLHCLHCEPDGRFPHRAPDCARTANLTALRRAVLQLGARLGIAWDGDGDRAAFIDETGEHVSTDVISALFARRAVASAAPGEAVVCDIKLSDAVRREVQCLGGRPVLERSGHAFMRARILAENALLGLDACGHYFFREAGFRDDGLYAALYLIELMGAQHSLAALRASVGPIHSSPELRIPLSALDYPTILHRIRSAFPSATELHVDGVRLCLEDRIILVRESSTEPVVSLRIEGTSKDAFEDAFARAQSALPEVVL